MLFARPIQTTVRTPGRVTRDAVTRAGANASTIRSISAVQVNHSAGANFRPARQFRRAALVQPLIASWYGGTMRGQRAAPH
jgi:hypothetical protein